MLPGVLEVLLVNKKLVNSAQCGVHLSCVTIIFLIMKQTIHTEKLHEIQIQVVFTVYCS